ncbi:MAG TPA: helix-turn-helix transcriptional regulator [Candidatus Limnocylindrales bacterium]|jgi:transcriptional regulator with XRE-family HTH domain|nr:helix-turn-helix transcriptional regulator [Candidatus Limnocylindrales bacterium]
MVANPGGGTNTRMNGRMTHGTGPALVRAVPSRRGLTIRQAIREGDRELDWSSRRVGEEIRALRLRAGIRQADLARAIGVDRAVISRLEAGDGRVSARTKARAAALLGAAYRQQLFPVGEPYLVDGAQARIVERLLELRHRRWRAIPEAPVPGDGRRSTDVRLECWPDIVLVEVETHVRRLEEVVRECHTKRAAVAADVPPGWRVHAALVLPPTRHHRALVRTHRETLASAFPVPDRTLRAALVAPAGPWPGDGILWLSSRPSR